MNAPQRFEDRLLAQLRRVVAEREDSREPTHNRTGRRAPGAFRCRCCARDRNRRNRCSRDWNRQSNDRAYAIQVRPGGKVAVSIYRLGDAKALQRSLRAAGVPAVVDFEATKAGRASSPLE